MAEQTQNKTPDCLDRHYRGRGGWGPAAVWDSIVYVLGLLRGAVVRRIARRRTLKKHGQQEQLYEVRLIELGRTALYLDGFDPKVLEEFRVELQKLELREKDLDEKLAAVKKEREEKKLKSARAQESLESAYGEKKSHRRGIEEELDPLIAEHREFRSKLQRAEWEIEHLERKVMLGDEDLDRLSKEGAAVSDLSKLRAKLSRWKGEIKEIERTMPDFRQRIQRLKPEITQLGEKLNEAKEQEEQARQAIKDAMAEFREEVNEIEQRQTKFQEDLSTIEEFKTNVYKECGEALNWNRIEEPGLEGRYGELDAIEKERKRLQARAARLDQPEGKVAWEPMFRFGIVVVALVLCILIVLKLTVW
jgi:chromosome segregation ATPase